MSGITPKHRPDKAMQAWALARGLALRGHEVIARLRVDEKAIAKRHRYLTVVADLERSRVPYLAEDRKQESLETLTPAQQEGIAAIAMDMWEPYIQSTLAHVDDAPTKIVFDKFHIATHLHDAVDRVRKADHRALQQAKDDRLTGTKYLWLMHPQVMTEGSSAATSKSPRPRPSRSGSATSGRTRTAGPRRHSSPAGSDAPPTAG